MPSYDYDCDACGPFTVSRPMAESGDSHACPGCAKDTPRAFLTPPRLLGMDAGQRIAHAVNERARHEPLLSSQSRSGGSERSLFKSSHGPGCGCCSPGKRQKGVFTADGGKTFPSRRPWMISH